MYLKDPGNPEEKICLMFNIIQNPDVSYPWIRRLNFLPLVQSSPGSPLNPGNPDGHIPLDTRQSGRADPTRHGTWITYHIMLY